MKCKHLAFFCTIFMLLFSLTAFAQSINWETPRILVQSGARFVNAVSGGDMIALMWQEFDENNTGSGGKIYLSLWTTTDTVTWKKNERFAGPFTFSDKETQIYSLVVDRFGNIYCAVVSGERKTTLYYSDDGGSNFVATEITAGRATVSPRLFLRDNGEFFLFLTYETKDNLSLYYIIADRSIFFTPSHSKEFRPFLSNENLGFNFLPHHCHYRGLDYIAFQASDRGTAYQIYIKISDDGGITWSDAKQITTFTERWREKEQAPIDFKNQRPYIKAMGDSLFLTWERQFTGEVGQVSQIYYAELREDGGIKTWERVTNTSYASIFPQIIHYNNMNYLIWFDNPGKDHIRIAHRGTYEWETKDLTPRIDGDSRFPQPVQIRDNLYIFWETVQGTKSLLYILEPDQSVRPPDVYPLNFSPGKPSQRSTVAIRWTVPEDPSGIASFLYAWTQSRIVRDELMQEVYRTETSGNFEATKDGVWYFHIKAGDLAGNWSDMVTVSFIRDTTPPGKVSFKPLKTDERGFLTSNSFSIDWNPPPDGDVAGYAYVFEKISGNSDLPLDRVPPDAIRDPPSSIMLFATEKSYNNRDNGVWGFSVRAIDRAGNAGEPAVLFFRLNKYIPVTIVSNVFSRQNSNNETVLSIEGRGFLTDGVIEEIHLDKDGNAPYDYSYEYNEADYSIKNDRFIDELKPDIEEKALFRLLLIHKKRGRYIYPYQLEIEPGGTVKARPPDTVREEWQDVATPLLSLSMNEAVIWLIVLFLSIVSITSLTKLAGVVREGQIIQAEVLAIMKGKEPEDKKKTGIRKLRTKGVGLRIKFTLLITSLILIIILMLSITLSYYMIETQGKNLAEGLEKQVKVLIGSLASGAEKYLPLQNALELDALVDQTDAMEEARHATITGISRRGSEEPSMEEFVWATNNEEGIDAIIDTQEYRVGESVIEDEVSPLVPDIAKEINRKASEQVGELVEEINELIKDYAVYALRKDQQAIQEAARIDEARKEKSNLVTQILHGVSNSYEGSVPPFDVKNLKESYVFYKPVVYRGRDIFFRGMVRVEVSTENILETISQSRTELIRRIIIISLIAIALGIAGAILLASITILPIKKLARGVAIIRDTEDKTALKDHIIEIRQKDEIQMLAETINQMTQGLVKAAIANKDLTVGKEVQKMFIPLERDENGKKGSTGEDTNKFIEIFGYYEGAKGVSGDYFDFVRLDDAHYAIIKCDVAGKGVPAALIMVEVATIFIDYFHGWKASSSGVNTEELVYKINDLVEERGFKGRFAALIVAIIDIKKGIAYCCNAGDNILHSYSAQKDDMVQIQLPQAPAAGVFPSDLVQMQTSFKQVPVGMKQDDILFLFSDGFDEAKRLFRNRNFEPVKCDEPSIRDNEPHLGTHNKGDDGEEFGIERLYGVIDAVIHGKQYRLIKHHNPVQDEELVFDFYAADRNIRNIIMAMVSVEKIYRTYKNPKAGPEDKILVDRKVDAFLQEHFLQYGEYFRHRIELSDNPAYVAFSHINEDEQYDDLTILGVRKK
ncbi:MAG: SpoIIE family protein phosphatase [Spirochaetales bacterium]|nr:SpoIIE family protein phosphatase [Spirochaetales bacterium]